MAMDMNGLRAGEAGEMLVELQHRGLAPGLNNLSNIPILMTLPTNNGKTVGSRVSGGESLRQILDSNPRIRERFATADADRIATLLSDWSGPVVAARDLLGFHGQTAPSMRGTFDTIDKIMGGAMIGMPPGDVAMNIRRVHHITQSRPGSLDSYLAAVTSGGQIAEQIGLDRSFAAMTAQASTAFGVAFERSGGLQGVGGLSRDEATALDQQLRLAAGASPLANSLGAVMSMHADGLIRGGRASELVAAIQSGNSTKINSIASTPAQIMQILKDSNVSPAAAMQYIRNSRGNQEFVARNNLQDTVRQIQGQGEIASIMRRGLESGMAGVLSEAGFARDESAQAASAAAAAAQQALMGMRSEQISDPAQREERNKAIAAAISATAPNLATRLGPGGMNSLVNSAVQGLEGLISRHSGLRKFKNLAGLVTMNRGDLLAQGHVIQGQAHAEGAASDLFSGVQGGISGAIDAIGGAGATTGVWDVIQSGLGALRSPSWKGGGLAAMQTRDRQVRAQEELHHKLAGPWALGSPRYTQQVGPDGRMYATGGEVQMDMSPIAGDPHATMAKMAQIEHAATAPARHPGTGGMSAEDAAIAHRAFGLRQAAAVAAMPAKSPGSGGSPAGGLPQGTAGGGGPLRITGTLTIKSDGTADIDAGWNAVGMPPAPPAL